MYKFVPILLTLLTLFSSCTESYDQDFTIDFDDSMISVFGELPGGERASVQLWGPIKAGLIIYDEVEPISTADVYLFRDRGLIDTLIFDADRGKYYSTTLIAPGATYTVHVHHGGKVITSENVTVPFKNGVNISSYNKYEFDGQCLGFKIFIDFDVVPRAKEVRGLFIYTRFTGNGSLSNCVINADFGECENFVNSDCSTDSVFVWNTYRLPKEYGKISDYDHVPAGIAYPFEITLTNYSDSYVKFYNSRIQSPSFDQGFIAPKDTYSNVNGAYGIIYGRSWTEVKTHVHITK